MLKQLGNIIEKKPGTIIIIILLITLTLSTLIPQIEMKTEFEDFMPEEEIIIDREKITDYFGRQIQIMFLYLESENIFSLESIKEQRDLEQYLADKPEIDGTISLSTFLNQICLINFQRPIEECTDEEIKIALEDLFSEKKPEEIKILKEDSSKKENGLTIFKRIFNRKSKDSLDIKNAYAQYNDETITFTIEVYDLTKLNEELKPPLFLVNTVEWYIDFENKITLHEDLDIKYKLSAHIEPKHSIWNIGDGIIPNFRNIFQTIRQKELFDSFEKTVYLWMKPPQVEFYFPIELKNSEINFEQENNYIKITTDREEIGKYGIATKIGAFELPTKLSNFNIGSRYYKNQINLPWSRITANAINVFQKIENIQNRPLLRNIADRLLQKHADMNYYEFIDFFLDIEKNIPISDKIALKDIDLLWQDFDHVVDKETVFFIRPNFYEDLKITTEVFISTEGTKKLESQASLILLQLNTTKSYDETLQNAIVIETYLKDLNKKSIYISVEATGGGIISKDINRITSESNQFIGPTIFIIIIIILFLSFRKFSYVALPMIALLVSVIWLFGTLVLLGISFSVMHVALIPLIIGLGVDYSVHLFHNYKIELEKGKTSAEAMKNSVLEIGNAMFLAMLTTVIAFMSFLASTVPALKDFGLLLGIGILYTFILAITLLPALRYILDRNKKDLKPKKQNIFDVSFLMKKVSRFVLHYNKMIVIIVVIFSIFLAVGASQLKTGFDLNEFAPEDTPSIQLFEKIGEKFPASAQTQEYILIKGNVASVKTLEGIAKTHENFKDCTFIAKNPDGSLKTESVYTVIKDAISSNRSLIKRFNIDEQTGIPRTDKDVKNLFDYLYERKSFSLEDIEIDGIDFQTLMETDFEMDDTQERLKNVLHRTNSEYDATVMRVYVRPTAPGNDNNIDRFLRTIKNELSDSVEDYGDAKPAITGQNIITLTITDSLTESQILSTAISMILAAIVLIIAYKNPLLGVIALIPVGITMIWILGTMYFIGYSLNALTITITSITIGIGIDYSIHATERFKRVVDKTGDIKKAMCETISHTGGALLIAALTTACGFGILTLAPMPPQQQFGLILSITIIFSLVTSILILPSVLVYWAKDRKKRKGYIVTTNGLKKINGRWIKESELDED